MCTISTLLNRKPQTEYASEMRVIEAGQRMLIGHGYKLRLAAQVNANTGERSERFIIEPPKGFPAMQKCNEIIDVDKRYNETTGIRITPISKTYTDKQLKVNIYIELTRSLNLAG